LKINKKIEHIDKNNFINQYLSSCGIEDIQKYLNPDKSCFEDPFNYLNMKKAIEVFDKHIHDDKIGIVVDSDLDGACSSAIAYMFCRCFGSHPKLYYHTGKQHGIHDKIDEIINDQISFLIVPDAGTNDIEDCQLFHDAIPDGDILILDHHEILYSNPYCVLINNQQGNVNACLSGTGVTYKFIEAYCVSNNMVVPDYKDIVAISIVSDICDLTSIENRAFLYYGLNNPKNSFLITLFNTVCNYRGVNPTGIGWEVAPLANALARMDEQKYKSFFLECLIDSRPDYDNAIKEMKRVKRKQDDLVREITKEIELNLNLEHKAIIGFTEPENKEIIGLIANKFTGKYRKPTILLRELNSTTWTGSLRSPFGLLEEINKSKIAQCIGHECACGITINKANLKKLAKFLDDLDIEINPEFDVVGELNIKDIDLDFAKLINENKMLWGKNIEKPKFYIHLENPTVNIFKKSTNTLKLTQNGIDFMKFFCSNETINEFENLNNQSVNIIFEIEINEYNGNVSAQGNILEYEIEKNNILKNEENEFDWNSIFV